MGQYRHVTRPVTAEDGRMENPWFGRLRKQASNWLPLQVTTWAHSLLPQSDPPSSGLTVPQFLPLDGMRNSSTRHSQEMNSEHLPRALYGHKIPLAVGLDNQGTTMVVKRCEAQRSQASEHKYPLPLSWTMPEAKELKISTP